MKRSFLILILIPAIASLAHADTIRMRNGTEYEGEVVAEKDDHYVVKVQVTKTIRDERKIPKSDVLEIVAERKDEIAFAEIKGLVPAPDLLTMEDYDARISQVESFMAAYPESPLLRDADKMLKALDEERKVVAAGGLKFQDKMIGSGERSAHAYPLDAKIAAAKVRNQGDAGNVTEALRAWTELKTRFGTSQAFVELIPYAQNLLTSHLRNIEGSLATFDARVKKREDGLARIDQRDRERSKRAIDDASAAYKAKLAEEKEAKVVWPSLDPYHKEPMLETKRMLEREIGDLERLDTSTLPDGDKAWNDAWKTVNGSADPQEVSAAMSAARSARLPAEYIQTLEARAPKR